MQSDSSSRPSEWRTAVERLLMLVAVIVGAAAVYEAAVALELIAIGWLQATTRAGASLYCWPRSSLCSWRRHFCAAAIGRHRAPSIVVTLLAPLAVALVVARFYSFDPYYAPTLRRMSEGGVIAGRWVLGLVAAAIVAAALTRAIPPLGRIAAPIVLVLSAFTAVLAGIGH